MIKFVTLLVFLGGVVGAQPFEPEVKVSLGAIDLDGNWSRVLRIGNWGFGDNEYLPIFAKHRIHDFGFQRKSSVIECFPFGSLIDKESKESLLWRRPGGGTVRLKRETRAPNDLIVNHIWQTLIPTAGQAKGFYQRGAVKCFELEHETYVVLESRYVLKYRRGMLVEFWTPHGSRVCVTPTVDGYVYKSGGYILSITRGREGLTYNVNGSAYFVVANDEGRVFSIRTPGKDVYKFEYDKKGLLVEFTEQQHVHSLGWSGNPEYGYRNYWSGSPLVLRMYNGAIYRRENSGPLILLFQAVGERVERLVVKQRYGTYYSLEE